MVFVSLIRLTAFTIDMFIGMELLRNPCHAALSTEEYLAP